LAGVIAQGDEIVTMNRNVVWALVLVALVTAPQSAARDGSPTVKVLPVAEDATQKTVLVGRSLAEGMIIQLELEPAKAMWMPMGNPPVMGMEHNVAPGESFHVEVKPIDPRSRTRIPYVDIKFAALNRDKWQAVVVDLHPMWGSSGLHYAANSRLAGDGTYEATVIVGVPTLTRDLKDKDLWMKPAAVKFHFKLVNGKLTEVTEPMAEATAPK
jgi:hypothetical protein